MKIKSRQMIFGLGIIMLVIVPVLLILWLVNLFKLKPNEAKTTIDYQIASLFLPNGDPIYVGYTDIGCRHDTRPFFEKAGFVLCDWSNEAYFGYTSKPGDIDTITKSIHEYLIGHGYAWAQQSNNFQESVQDVFQRSYYVSSIYNPIKPGKYQALVTPVGCFETASYPVTHPNIDIKDPTAATERTLITLVYQDKVRPTLDTSRYPIVCGFEVSSFYTRLF